jgi:hypothetical protein
MVNAPDSQQFDGNSGQTHTKIDEFFAFEAFAISAVFVSI